MTTRLKSLTLLSSLFILILCWSLNLKTTLPSVTSKDTLEKLSDVRITHLKVQFFDEEGHLTHHLSSPWMAHIPYHNTHRLTSPQFIITQPDKPQWIIRSDNAIAKQNGKEIILSHHVTLKHSPFQAYSEGIIETEQLHYYPKKNYAMTSVPITWKQQDNAVLSHGMKAYFDDNRIDLFNAEATYEPTA